MADKRIKDITQTMTDLLTDAGVKYLGGDDATNGSWKVSLQSLREMLTKQWAEPQKGYIFDGTNDYISWGDNAQFDVGLNDFSYSILMMYPSTPNANEWIYGKHNTGTDLGWFLRASASSITAYLDDGLGATIGVNIPVSSITYGEPFLITVTHDRDGDMVIYLNGKPITTNDISSFSSVNFDNNRSFIIGVSNAIAFFFSGSIYQATHFNYALTQAEVTALYNNGRPQDAEVPFKYRWGSQTNLVTNGTFTTDTDWTKEAQWTIGSGVAHYDNTVTDKKIYQNLVTPIVAGKKYRITYTISNATGNAKFGFLTGAGNLLFTSGDAWVLTQPNGTYTIETMAIISSADISIFAQINTTFDIDNVSVVEIGAVASYKGENATLSTSTWFDESSNALNGTTSGSPQLLNANRKALGLPTYADNTAALAGGLIAGDLYRTSTGIIMVVY